MNRKTSRSKYGGASGPGDIYSLPPVRTGPHHHWTEAERKIAWDSYTGKISYAEATRLTGFSQKKIICQARSIERRNGVPSPEDRQRAALVLE